MSPIPSLPQDQKYWDRDTRNQGNKHQNDDNNKCQFEIIGHQNDDNNKCQFEIVGHQNDDNNKCQFEIVRHQNDDNNKCQFEIIRFFIVSQCM